MSNNSGAGFVSGFLLGALIGAAIGLLYAPQPGTETRRAVKEKAKLVKDDIEKAAGRVKDTVSGRFERRTD